MNFLSKLASDTAVYGISTIVSRFVNYVLFPFHLLIFDAAPFGTISELYAYVAVLNIIFLYGMETAFFRFCNDADAEREKVKNAVQSLIILTTFLFSLPLFVFSEQLATFAGYAGHGDYIRILAFILFADTILAVPFAALRLENKAKKFAALRSGAVLLNVFLNFLILGLFRGIYSGEYFPFAKEYFAFYNPSDEIYYVYLANALANIAVLPFFLPYFKKFHFVFDTALVKKMLLYALPFVVTGLAYNLNEALSRNLIKYLLPENFYPGKTSLEALGIYSANFRFAVFISLAVQAFKFSAEPFFFKKALDKDSKEVFALVMRYFILLLCLMYVVVSLNTDTLQFIMGKAIYREGIVIVPILLLANIFLGIYYNLAVWYKVTDRTYYGAAINAFSLLITLAANLILLPILGYIGSALSTLFCFAGMAFLCYFFGKKFYPVPYFVGNAAFLIISSTALIYGCNIFIQGDFWEIVFFKNAVMLIFFSGIFLYEKKQYPKMQQYLQ
jgi:O-antigen/teichoic acid export membrane protein